MAEKSVTAVSSTTDADQTTTDANEASEDSSKSQSQDANAAANAAPDAESKDSLLEVLRDVVVEKSQEDNEPEAKAGPDESESEESSSSSKSEDSDAKADAKADDDELPPFHEHPRWKEKQAEVEALKPRAEQYDNITSFLDENRINHDEMAELFTVAALLKNNPAEALKRIQPTIDRLKEFLGDTLPTDLQEKVDVGMVDKDTASELAASRNRNEFDAARTDQQSQDAQAAQAAQAQSDHIASVVEAVTGWEESASSKDPDFAMKRRFVRDRIRAITVEEGQPKTPADAVSMSQRALVEVTEEFRASLPKREPKTINTGRSQNGVPSPEPTTLLEAVRLAAGREAA